MTAPLVRARGIARFYRDGGREHAVLNAIDLDIHPGELVVVLGRSGSGKSTLLNVLGAMDVASAGELTVEGLRIDQLSESARARFRRARVGFVFQSFNLLPTLTVAENLALPLELNGVNGVQAEARVQQLLAALGLSDRLQRFPDELSGGEQQRVAVGRALAHTPALVIADEPTGNLDIETGRQVLALLDRLTREEGRTLVMATHSQEVIGMADRVLTIHDGYLVEAVR